MRPLYIRMTGLLAQGTRNAQGLTLLNAPHTRSLATDAGAKHRFLRLVSERLPDYRELFQQAALETGVDWRLLAAVGYQESHWNPGAVSPTGVRGLMMLTRTTAQALGISNRTDARASVFGGARYLRKLWEELPERIREPDRTWLALAAYNVGRSHLEDARILTQRAGDDPDRWADVRRYLPRLAQKKWYQRTEHGYARGWEPVRYVANVRAYYNMLIWQVLHQRVTQIVDSAKEPS